MKLYIITFIIFVFSLTTQTSHAESELHSQWFQESKEEVVQEVYSDVRIYFDGRISATSHYLNRRNMSHVFVATSVRLYGPDNKLILGFQFGAYIPPRYGVPAVEYNSEKLKLLDSVLVEHIQWVGIAYTIENEWQYQSNQGIWNVILASGIRAVSVNNSTSDSKFRIGNIPVKYLSFIEEFEDEKDNQYVAEVTSEIEDLELKRLLPKAKKVK